MTFDSDEPRFECGNAPIQTLDVRYLRLWFSP